MEGSIGRDFRNTVQFCDGLKARLDSELTSLGVVTGFAPGISVEVILEESDRLDLKLFHSNFFGDL